MKAARHCQQRELGTYNNRSLTKERHWRLFPQKGVTREPLAYVFVNVTHDVVQLGFAPSPDVRSPINTQSYVGFLQDVL